MAQMEKPHWVKMNEKEMKDIIVKLAEKHSPSQIGMVLRDQYGIPSPRIFGKKLNDYLKEEGIEVNEDLENAEKKVDKMKEHLKNNITDRKAKHKLQKAQSRLNVLRNYFKK